MHLSPLPLAIPLILSLFSYGKMYHVARSPTGTDSVLPRDNNCVNPNPQNTLTDRMNLALNSSGNGYILSLCPSTEYIIEAPIMFAFPNQEISTQGYPTTSERATLVVNGPVVNGTGHTTAVDGTCSTCGGVKLRNIQINGTRNGSSVNGGANIEMGGANSGQIIEYVRSYTPRGWSCLHIAEGGLKCNNATVQNNDIGPCGSDDFQQWADGISFACANGLVRNNMVNNPTDGGIVLFGAPGTLVENNTIWIEEQTLLGGINMVDYNPWSGNYTGVVVQNNNIYGGFATTKGNATLGDDKFDAIIKIGIAIGPRVWFGNRYGQNRSFSATVVNNRLTGAFGYGIAISSARNFTVQNNGFFGGTSFIGSRGPNCSSVDTTPTSNEFVYQKNTTESLSIQSGFESITDGSSLTCIVPPAGGDFWPYGGNPGNSQPVSSGGPSKGTKVGMALGIVFGVALVAVLAWFIRKWAIARRSRVPTGRGRFVRGKF
ncbi:hypothetical protein DFH11DRAFT_1567138 [Phellopilus nigrolimitatus]|nr:hypothetical protein DFH11DRAFT_1567138 [Phellopilus nigrolimitatus]